MVAARWRTRRMWTIETGLLNAEILAQQSKSDNPDPSTHLASAFRSVENHELAAGTGLGLISVSVTLYPSLRKACDSF